MAGEDDIQWIVPIAVGAIIPFVVMLVSRIGSSQKNLQESVMNIDNLKADIQEIRNQTKEALGTLKSETVDIRALAKENINIFTERVNQIIKSIDELKADVKVGTYRLDQMEKRMNGGQDKK